MGDPRPFAWTTGRSSRPKPSSIGRRTTASSCVTSSRASPTRMRSSSASTEAFGTKCSTPTCSTPPARRRRSRTIGWLTTTRTGRTTRWGTCRPPNTCRGNSNRRSLVSNCPLDGESTLSLRVHLPALEEVYTDRNGDVASVYLDPTYNDTLGPSHEDALSDAGPLEIPGIDASKLDVRVLTPVDLAVSKLGRFNDHDRDDIRALAAAGLLDAGEFEARAEQALNYYVGRPAAPRASLREALTIIRGCSPLRGRPRSGGQRRPKKGG